eukprot:CFRG5108T1
MVYFSSDADSEDQMNVTVTTSRGRRARKCASMAIKALLDSDEPESDVVSESADSSDEWSANSRTKEKTPTKRVEGTITTSSAPASKSPMKKRTPTVKHGNFIKNENTIKIEEELARKSKVSIDDDDDDLDSADFVPVIPQKRKTPTKQDADMGLDNTNANPATDLGVDRDVENAVKSKVKTAAKEKKTKATRMASTMPLKLSSRLIPACIWETTSEVDLDGDTGAVGRFFAKPNDDNIIKLDLKGYTYSGKPRPCSTFMVVKVNSGEAKVESLIDTYLDLECIDSVYNATEVLTGNIDEDDELESEAEDGNLEGLDLNPNGKRAGNKKTSGKTSTKKVKVLASDDVAPAVSKATKTKTKKTTKKVTKRKVAAKK